MCLQMLMEQGKNLHVYRTCLIYKLIAPFKFNRRHGGNSGEAVVSVELSIMSFKKGQNRGFDHVLREFIIESLQIYRVSRHF